MATTPLDVLAAEAVYRGEAARPTLDSLTAQLGMLVQQLKALDALLWKADIELVAVSHAQARIDTACYSVGVAHRLFSNELEMQRTRLTAVERGQADEAGARA